LVDAVEPDHVLSVQPVHAAGEVGFRGLDEEVKVIRHQDERADAPAETPDGLSEEFEEDFAVVVVVEDGSPLIAAGGDVMECASEVGAKCSCHVPRLPRNSQEGPKLFPLEPKRAPTSSEWKPPPTTGRHSGLDPKKEGTAPRSLRRPGFASCTMHDQSVT